MELHICHLYPNLLNMYGDVGNVKILKYRAEKRGISVFVHTHTAGELPLDFAPDIMMLGSGQAFEMRIAAEDLRKHKEKLSEYIESDGVLLAIGSGFQLLGDTCILGENEEEKGLSLLPIHTEMGEQRFVGDIALKTEEDILVGFENHAGKTYIGDLTPLGTTLLGFGNNGEDETEGARYKNVYGTFLHGPLLSKNPKLADEILYRALKKKDDAVLLAPMDDTYAEKAKEELLYRWGV